MMPRPWYKPGWMLRLPFRGGKCKCDELICTCCTGVRIETINFDRSSKFYLIYILYMYVSSVLYLLLLRLLKHNTDTMKSEICCISLETSLTIKP